MSTKKLTRDAQDFDDLHARPSRKAGTIKLPSCAIAYECDPDGRGMVVTSMALDKPAFDFIADAYTILYDMLNVVGDSPDNIIRSLRDRDKEEDAL